MSSGRGMNPRDVSVGVPAPSRRSAVAKKEARFAGEPGLCNYCGERVSPLEDVCADCLVAKSANQLHKRLSNLSD